MGSIFETIVDFIYPRRCPVCGDIVLPRGAKICPTCKEKLIYINEPRCKKCSKAILNEEQEYCFDCTKKQFSYVKGFSLFEYDKGMQHSMSEFKFHSKKEYADFYIEELITRYGTWIQSIQPCALIPVPIHVEKRRQRGYNQAELLAQGLGKALDIKVLNDVLIREKNTTPQKLLDDKERVKNLKHAFAISNKYKSMKEEFSLQRVLLIDDIYTTGTTIDVCTKALQGEGIREVYFMTVCIGKGY